MHSVRISTRPIHEENELVGLRGVLTDVTEFKRLEQHLRQAQKMDAIGQLAGGIAHDFNNLLTAIMGFAELLRNRPLSAEARRTSLDEIVKAAERAAGLTQQLLAFSRQQQLEPQVLDLNLLLSEMDKMLQRLIGDDILLALSLDRSLGRVRADPSQIQQIILNLVVNARDAMPQGGRVLVQTANQTNAESGAESVVLTVSDNGVGMTPEVRARIFEPFFTTKEIGKGTGLGLSTVYGIVRQSGGRIEVATTLGQGSTFTVFLPRSIALSARIKEDPLPAPVLPAPLLPPAALLRGIGTVLVVDDNESVAKIAVEILQNAGAEVLVAGDAAEALAICDRQEVQIGLLVTDVVMPGLNGLQLAEELQKRFPAMRVLFISGYANDIIDAGSGDLSGHSFLRKPFQEDALLRKVASVIKA